MIRNPCFCCGGDGKWPTPMKHQGEVIWLCDCCSDELNMAIETFSHEKVLAMRHDKARKIENRTKQIEEGQLVLC